MVTKVRGPYTEPRGAHIFGTELLRGCAGENERCKETVGEPSKVGTTNQVLGF